MVIVMELVRGATMETERLPWSVPASKAKDGVRVADARREEEFWRTLPILVTGWLDDEG